MPHGQPNYLNIDVNGRVSALFTGGLILPIDPNNTPGTTSTSVTWTRSEDGSWLARITASRTTISPPAGDAAQMQVRSPNNAHTAEVNVQAYDTNNPPNQLGTGAAAAHALADTRDVKIIDSLGQSSFMLKGGPLVVSWPGGSAYSNVATVAHQSGTITTLLALALLQAGDFAMEVFTTGFDAVNANFRCRASDGTIPVLGAQRTIYWSCA